MKSPLNRGGLRFYLVFLALAAGTLYFRTTNARSIVAGLPLILLGICLHTWAKGCLRQNRQVATIGPYRWVRHPFYLANALIDAGLVVMSGFVPLAVILPLWWLAIYIPVIRGEERYLCEKFPDEYPAYRSRVSCLVPWRRPLPYAGEGFRWTNPNISGGEELPRALRILAYPLLFLVAAGLRAGGVEWLQDGWHLAAVTGLLSLYVFAWQLERHQRRRRYILPWALQHPIFRAIAAVAVVAAVASVAGPRTGYRNAMPIFGGALWLLSVPVFSRRGVRTIAAEMLALLGAIAAGELPWLAPPVAAVYAAWMLDRVLGETGSDGQASDPPPMPRWPYLYPLIAIACAAVIGATLAGHALPYHWAGF